MPEAGSRSSDVLSSEFWDADSIDPFSVHVCDPGGMSVWALLPPADAEHRVGRTLRGQAGSVSEAVFSGDSSELQDDFDAVTQALTDCLEGPGDPNLAEVGYELVAEELPTVGVGDADYLIHQRLYYLNSTRPFCDHRLAIVLDGTRLVLVEYNAMGGNESVSDDDFAMIVQNAAQRITS